MHFIGGSASLELDRHRTAGICTPKDTPFFDWPDLSPAIAPGTLLRYQRMSLPAFYRAKAWRILYMTRDYADRPILSSGMVVLSGYAPPNPAARNIVAWAHPTTGVARKCAPSLRQSPTNSIVGFNDLIPAGYIIAATDYPGLGTAGPMGYLVGKGQGQAVIDSVRAARQIPEVGGGSRYALWGYSQGGHAALFAAGMASAYAPELKLVGIAAAAPPTNLVTLLGQTIGSLEGRILAAMTLESWSVKFNVPLGTLVDNQVARVVSAVTSYCVDDLGGKLDAVAAEKPLKDKFLTYNPATQPPWSSFMTANSISKMPRGIPAFIAQGKSDQIVRRDVTQRFVQAQCAAGIAVKYLTLDGMDHGGTAKASSGPAIAWIGDRFADKAAPSSCN
jgi:acetyl esterase/lipase